jgi:Zn-dependent peptidase ImmA (M78 family)
MNKREIIKKFIEFVKMNLGLKTKVKIILTNDRDEYGITTTAFYDVINHIIIVYVKNRALVDVLRSIGHEMVHHLQNEEGRIGDVEEDGSDGSNIENEANAKAGELIRIFGKQNNEIYE